MRIAGNKLKHVADFFHSELATTFERGEIDAMMGAAIQKFVGVSRSEIHAHYNDNLNQSDLLKLYDCAKALKKNVPLQYILREAWFYDLKFYVDPHVLIPRPETEELVELVIKDNKKAHSFFDIGTGSGCIPVTVKKNIPEAEVFACDISERALKIAKKNADSNQVVIGLLELDILNVSNLENKTGGPFDVIISNPPYIQLSEKEHLSKHVAEHEPDIALFVNNDDPIIFYKKIIDLCQTGLNSHGRLYFELNPLTADLVKDYANLSGIFEKVDILKDMSGNTRFLRAVKNKAF
jgi:release factor glutamine methyltransferase